jgi:hypothetical protein
MFTALRSAAKVLGAFATIAAGSQMCDGAVAVFSGTGNAYEVVLNSSANVTTAMDAATAAGGHLVTITSSAEQSFIESLLISSSAPTGSYWMGLGRTAPNADAYAWTTGEPFAYKNFAPGEPNNYLSKEDNAQIYWTQDIADDIKSRRGGWNDSATTGYPSPEIPLPEIDLARAGFIIERAATAGDPPPVGIPLPPALLAAPVAMLVAGAAARRQRKAMLAK